MKPLVTLVTVITLGIGALAGTAAYQVAAAPRPESVGVPVAKEQTHARVVPGARFRWAPCRDQAALRRGVCVTELVKTITVPVAATDDAPASVVPPLQQPVTTSPEDASGEAESDAYEAEDDEAEDHESDEHEDEDHEDEPEDGEHGD